MDVHPPKNGINRYWSIPILSYHVPHFLSLTLLHPFAPNLPSAMKKVCCRVAALLDDGSSAANVSMPDFWTGCWQNILETVYAVYLLTQKLMHGTRTKPSVKRVIADNPSRNKNHRELCWRFALWQPTGKRVEQHVFSVSQVKSGQVTNVSQRRVWSTVLHGKKSPTRGVGFKPYVFCRNL